MNAPENGVPSAPLNGRRARVSTEDSAEVEPVAIEETVLGSDDSSNVVESNSDADPDREARRKARSEDRQIARAEKRRPRAPLAEKNAVPRDSVTTASANEDESPEDTATAVDASPTVGEALAIDLSGKKSGRSGRAAKRARSKQESAAAAVKDADDHPAIGALNRHLNMLTQQLGTAHRVIGRLAAERDAFRQELAELQGIPVEAIQVTSVGQTSSRQSRARKDLSGSAVEGIAVASPKEHNSRRSKVAEPDPDSDEPSPPSVMERLNYFGVDDVAVARKRRQMLALSLLVVVVVLWLSSRMGVWQVPSDLSRDSLAHLPVIGELMSYFLAGWVMYRVVRVGSRGVKWVFPTEKKRKR